MAQNAKKDLQSSSLLFMNPSTIHWGQGLVFDADLAVHFPLYNGLNNLALKRDVSRYAHNLTFTFQTEIRMMNTRSNPVRTPSYNPLLAYQFFYLKRMDPDGEGATFLKPILVVSPFLSFEHYSNGQEGPTYFTTDAGLAVNSYNGDFSTTYLRGGIDFAHIKFNEDEQLETKYELRMRTKFLQFRKPVFGAINEEQLKTYNPQWETTITADYLHRFSAESFIQLVNPGATWTWFPLLKTYNELIDPHQSNIALYTNLYFKGIEQIGLNLKYEYGQDLYNIRYAETIDKFYIGVVAPFPYKLSITD